MLPNRLEVQLRGGSVRVCGERCVLPSLPRRSKSAVHPESGNERTILKKISKRKEDIFRKMSEDTDNIAVEENVEKHLQKDLNMEENQNIIETLRAKVREKLKNAKINQGKKSSTQLLIDNKIYQWSKVNKQTEVSLDEGLSFFILSGEEDSTLGQSAEQRSVNDSYHKHFSLGDNLQNFAEGRDEDFMEEVIFLDLLEVKAADYEDDQEQVKKQQANIFVPSNSPVINQLKLPKDMMPRILEDEGFYVHKKPEIYKKTCNKMENRLLKLEEASSLANKGNHSLMVCDICF
ncbi:protein CC2D2B homolog [Physeter macrocephalus]|uniref:Protein CC2D2B homolog n=1 Tax=Physeter macrocephalus TaxID=9755 RepID=A0A9W2WDY1_PHYMC|nr:protein CC2D2B homolog [Physeter catodon]